MLYALAQLREKLIYDQSVVVAADGSSEWVRFTRLTRTKRRCLDDKEAQHNTAVTQAGITSCVVDDLRNVAPNSVCNALKLTYESNACSLFASTASPRVFIARQHVCRPRCVLIARPSLDRSKTVEVRIMQFPLVFRDKFHPEILTESWARARQTSYFLALCVSLLKTALLMINRKLNNALSTGTKWCQGRSGRWPWMTLNSL